MKKRTIVIGWIFLILNTIFTLSSIPSDKIFAIGNPILRISYIANFIAMAIISLSLFAMLMLRPIGWWILIITLTLCSFEMLAGLITSALSSYFPVKMNNVVIYLLYYSIPLTVLITDPPRKWDR
jgi:hypothetical protein